MSEALQRAKGIVDAANWFRDKPERWIVHEAADGSLSIATPLENGHLRIIDLNDPKVAAHVAMAGPETVSALLDAVAAQSDFLERGEHARWCRSLDPKLPATADSTP